MAVLLLAVPALAAVPGDIAADLQPLRPRLDKPDDLPPLLRPIAVLARKGKDLEACQTADALRVSKFHEAARLFYKPDRFVGADVPGIDKFLDAYVRGRTPLFEVPVDVFVPATPWRALALAACLRAGRGDLAVPFVAEAAGGSRRGAPDRVALAVALAVRAGQWRAVQGVLGPDDRGVRALLVRALAEADANMRDSLLLQARKAVTEPDEPALVTRIEAYAKTLP